MIINLELSKLLNFLIKAHARACAHARSVFTRMYKRMRTYLVYVMYTIALTRAHAQTHVYSATRTCTVCSLHLPTLTYAPTHTYTRTPTHTPTYTYTHTHTYTRTYLPTHAPTFTPTYTPIHTPKTIILVDISA